MVHIKPALSSLLILLFLFSPITTASAAAFSFPFPGSYSEYKTFISLAHSLFSRVSNQRAARGDISGNDAGDVSGNIAGANRAKLIAQSLERGLYVYDAVSELNQLTFISLAHSLFSRVSNLLDQRGDFAGDNGGKLIARNLEGGLYVYDAVSDLKRLTFISLARSVLSRVSNLRAARGDTAGANRAKLIAWRLEPVLYVYDAVSELNQLSGFISDFGRAGSEIEKTTWVPRNYRTVLEVAWSVLPRLVKVFSHSTVQIEVREGDLLRDCLEVGSGDLQGLVQIIKDVTSQYYPTSSNYNNEL